MDEIAEKWQRKWEEEMAFEVHEDPRKPKFYCLEMFPYPSGSGLHMGHAFNYTIGDIYARYKRMNGYNVLYPMGYDSFGLPAENAAIKEGVHPKEYTEKAISNFIRQQKKLGLSYDWNRIIKTHTPEYYKWDQWIFLQMFKKGLAYKKKAPVSYCPKCQTVLANEQIHDGKCWRHKDTDVEIKYLEQWFFKITDYVEELYNEIDNLKEWPERIKAMQKNWIGKSEGTEIQFMINGKPWRIFTTRPDTIYGVTFLVISAHHPHLYELVTPENRESVDRYIKSLKTVKEEDIETMEKEGVFTGSYALHPLTGEKIPVYAGNFVVAEYGSGMVMAVPAHDQRDFEFAKKYSIPIKVVIQPKDRELKAEEMKRAYTEEGNLVNSEQFTGMNSREAIGKITEYLSKKGIGKKAIMYKLRDWLISRQRYWGTPIPIIYCERCGTVPVPEEDLPVTLPERVRFGEGNPLLTNEEFIRTKCPKCGGAARRETDTMDTFVNSSWYFLRYTDPNNEKEIFSKEKASYWTPVDTYIGGAEHACMHLIYFRFYTKFLRDIGLINYREPVKRLFNQGMVHGPDGVVMSKSRGNVVDPLEMIEKYNVDTLRIYLVSTAGPDKDFIWSDETIQSSYRFVERIKLYFSNVKIGMSDKKTESKLNILIREVTSSVEEFKYNIAVIKLRQFFEYLEDKEEKTESKDVLSSFLKLLHPFCPHITEELWEKIGNNKSGKEFISLSEWPKADENKINLQYEKEEQMAKNLAADINNVAKLIKGKGAKIKKAYVYCLPNEKQGYMDNLEMVKRSIEMDIQVYAVNEKEKYDPQNKAQKAKPGKPAIYLEI
ncbi:MAG: leucine--tRNA ligase [Candidatus Micrarchaeota archaeon]|nr:leucine--tRNA ligase [Candidatus Micrarchaeota archaeon]